MKSVIKYPGSKWSTAEWIISYFPPGYREMTYLEPFFGSGAIFFNKERSKIETINDVNGRIVNLFKVIREHPDELIRAIDLTPWARDEYRDSYIDEGSNIERARRFIVRMWQAIGGKTSDITGWSNNIKPVDTGKSRWIRINAEIRNAAERLRHSKGCMVQIERISI